MKVDSSSSIVCSVELISKLFDFLYFPLLLNRSLIFPYNSKALWCFIVADCLLLHQYLYLYIMPHLITQYLNVYMLYMLRSYYPFAYSTQLIQTCDWHIRVAHRLIRCIIISYKVAYMMLFHHIIMHTLQQNILTSKWTKFNHLLP